VTLTWTRKRILSATALLTVPVALIATLTMLSGCGGAAYAGEAPPPAGSEATSGGGGEAMMVTLSPEDQSTLDAFDTDMEGLMGDMGSAMALETGPDCDLAGELRDRICDLSGRICDIADRHPEHGGVVEKCDDGRQRCERAREDVAAQCGE